MKRFWSKTKAVGDCLEWQGSLRGTTGYGAFKHNGKTVDAHRMAYLLSKGEIPETMLVCHTCDNRRCVKPEHLFLGSYKENYWDARVKGRIRQNSNEHLKKHPSIGAYNRGCRCSECCEIKNGYMRRWRARMRVTTNVRQFAALP